ncbi:unnamed protein product [Medioppia subpectinata]|uniref:HMG box domain-containing protein n=1 Tax=Medioppia subpectinata TaxID=1979941 RepID=A0A7R9L3A0_9ACAR|nr:unnamed protein product [Medioppia subpectinata]CAG2114749.1 unnamed protein product [Medioppia subpectinata]
MSFQLKFKEFLKRDQTMTSSHSDTDDNSQQHIQYFHRYTKLRKRCDAIKTDNERLIQNIHQMKTLSHKYRQQKRIIMKRLAKHRDNYMTCDLPLFLEKDESTQQPTSDVKPKHLVTKVNTNATNMSSKPKKSKPNQSRNEITSNGTVYVVPKKPINPYLLFCQENRSSLQEKYHMKYNAEMTHQELTKALAQQWHELSLTSKQIYYNLFNNDKIRYENEMKIFTANSSKKPPNKDVD